MESEKSEKRTDGWRLQCWAGSGKKEERQPWHYSPAAATPGGPPFSSAARGRRAREEDGMARRSGAVRTSEKRGDRTVGLVGGRNRTRTGRTHIVWMGSSRGWSQPRWEYSVYMRVGSVRPNLADGANPDFLRC